MKLLQGIIIQEKFYIYLIAFAIAFLISLLTTPLSKFIAFKVGAVDQL